MWCSGKDEATKRQPHRETYEQIYRQTGKRSDEPTDERTGGQAGGRPGSRPFGRMNEPTDGPSGQATSAGEEKALASKAQAKSQ